MKADTTLEDGLRRRRSTRRPISECPVFLRDHHPGYVSWEEYVSNQKRLSESAPARASDRRSGAPREGRALLQGILLCGRCGHRMNVRYVGHNGRLARYLCTRLHGEAIGDHCLAVTSRNIDEPIVDLLHQLLTRANLGDAVQVLELVQEQDDALEQQWKLRLERTRYEVKRAERQYDACDPDNRVVARTLEKRWNDKLVELEQLEREHQDVRDRKRLEITDVDRKRILDLAEDLPRLWRAAETTDRDRKALLRLLIKDVSVASIDVPRSALRSRVLWHTGAVTELEIERLGKGAPRSKRTRWQILTTQALTPPH
jgi:hypothetical protein